jgi:hypothetical protein
MKCKIRLYGDVEDIEPKFRKFKPEDQEWILDFPKPDGEPFRMNLAEVIRFLTMFNEVEEIYFEVR